MKYIIILFLIISSKSFGAETCSRTAIINHQEVLVDINSTQKGEGIRYYLEKDAQAKVLLDKYQKGTKTNWVNITLGTAGSSMVIKSLISGYSNKSDKKLFAGGIILISINFILSILANNKNELYLRNAIDEYNKRNLPKIYFDHPISYTIDNQAKPVVIISKTWDF